MFAVRGVRSLISTSGFKQLSKNFCTRTVSAWTGTHRLPHCALRHWSVCVTKILDLSLSRLSNESRRTHTYFFLVHDTVEHYLVLEIVLRHYY